jgi:ABC-2 type transport system ATP-binding protein
VTAVSPPGKPPEAIRLDRVTQRFPARRGGRPGEALALDAVTLAVPPGACCALLGPNGAGKTTLLRIVCALLRPTAGSVRVLGHDPGDAPEAVRRRVGAALGGERAVYGRLTGRENLLYAAALHDLDPAASRHRAAELLETMDLTERADDLVERYSTGMRQRLALARALVADPPMLLLDEPTAGLDPRAAADLRRLLADLRGPARTVLMATHNVTEAERLCDQVAILDRGRLLASGSPAQVAAAVRANAGDNGVLEAAFLALVGRPPDDRTGAAIS